MKKRYLIAPIIVVAILGFLLGYFIFKTVNLSSKLQAQKASNQQLETRNNFYTELQYIDSLLVIGNYNGALGAYQDLLTRDSLNRALVDNRIKLVDRLINFENQSSKPEDSTAFLKSEVSERPVIRSANDPIYDSMRFILDKANAQLENLKRKVKKSDNGNYLKFTNAKGYEVYYVGQVSAGKANGEGVALFSSGGRYEGMWQLNKREGKGVYYWPDGAYYEGAYENDKRSGLGIYVWPNGERFVGLWEEDQREGQGTFYDKEGKVTVKGLWSGDELIEEQK